MTAEDDSEAYWRQAKPALAKKYSSLALFTLLFFLLSPTAFPTGSTCSSLFSPSC